AAQYVCDTVTAPLRLTQQTAPMRRLTPRLGYIFDQRFCVGAYSDVVGAVTALATPARKYPVCRCHAAPAASHPAPSKQKRQRPRSLAGNPLWRPAVRASGRQPALETGPDHYRYSCQSRRTFHLVTTADDQLAAEIIPPTFGS